MQVICISRGSYGYSKQLAEQLAAKLGYPCIGREEITDAATDSGIPVGKLEMAVVKNRPLSEEMAVEISRYKAFVTAYLCERILQGSLVYHGRTGHLVLPGLTHTLRIHAIAELDDRIELAMRRLNLDRAKARLYNEQVDEDIRRWVRVLYGADWGDPANYHLTLNTSHLPVHNAAAALVHMAGLPEFQITPANRQVLKDLLLGARCRLALGNDERTHDVDVRVRADQGAVSVTYLPRQAKAAEHIRPVLEAVEGIGSLVCTVAQTSILCIGEQFDAGAESFGHLVEIAEKWNAAIELVHFRGDAAPECAPNGDAAGKAERGEPTVEHGGILDDDGDEPSQVAGCGVPEAMDRLIQSGRAGGYLSFSGGPVELVAGLPRERDCSLIVVGDVFGDRAGAQKRLKRDLISLLADKFRVPVLGNEELKSHYLFGPRQMAGLLVYGALSVALYLLVIGFQKPILEFVSAGHFGGDFSAKAMEAAAIVVFVPVVAFIIGGFYENLLKLVKLE